MQDDSGGSSGDSGTGSPRGMSLWGMVGQDVMAGQDVMVGDGGAGCDGGAGYRAGDGGGEAFSQPWSISEVWKV